MNRNICILESITEIIHPGSEYMNIHYSNIYSEGVILCHRTLLMIKTNSLNLKNIIFAVMCSKFPWIITVVFLNTWSNDWTEDRCSIGKLFGQYGIRNKSETFFLLYFKKKSYYHNYLWRTFRDSPMFFGVRFFSRRQTSVCETTGLTWSNMERIYSRSVIC